MAQTRVTPRVRRSRMGSDRGLAGGEARSLLRKTQRETAAAAWRRMLVRCQPQGFSKE